MEAIVVGIAALIGGLLLGRKMGAAPLSPALRQTASAQAFDRVNYLRTLRREMANILVWRDPQRYLDLYRNLHSEVSSLSSWRKEELKKRLVTLCQKYPNFNDFDFIDTRDYVLYPDAVSISEDAELGNKYSDIVIFSALSAVLDEDWAQAVVNATSDEELTHLTEYVKRIEDTKLKIRIERAMNDNALAQRDDVRRLDNDFYKIVDLPSLAENRYGVHLKRTNEFCIYSFFVFDDGRISQQYYRSDPKFETEQPLQALSAVINEITLER